MRRGLEFRKKNFIGSTDFIIVHIYNITNVKTITKKHNKEKKKSNREHTMANDRN